MTDLHFRELLKREIVALVVIVLLAPITLSSVQMGDHSSSAVSNVIVPSFFGITLDTSTTTWPVTLPFGTMGKTASGGPLGGSFDTYWLNLEPSNGTYDWTPLDNVIAAAKSGGVTSIMYTFFETPTWASSNPSQSCFATQKFGILGCAAPPKYINDWSSFVRALVTRYKGEIQYYELWNEPNIQTEYSGNITEMVTMAQNAYQIIKSIDSSAIVLTPGVAVGGIEPYSQGCPLSQCWLAEYLQAGGGSYADGVAFHGKTCISSAALCVQEGISCTSAQIEQCQGTSVVNQITDIRSLMNTYGVSEKPLVDTEGGYNTNIGEDALFGTADQQTATVSRFYIIRASEGLQVAVWFSWFPTGTVDNGTTMSGLGSLAASSEINEAYKETYNWLVGSTFNSPCSLSNGVWTCSLTNSQDIQELIVFADTNSSASTYVPANQYTQYQDLSGSLFTISSGSSVPVNEKPILLQSTVAVTSSTTVTTSSITVQSSSSTVTLSSASSSPSTLSLSSNTSSSRSTSTAKYTLTSVMSTGTSVPNSSSVLSQTSSTLGSGTSVSSGNTSYLTALIAVLVIIAIAGVLFIRSHSKSAR